MRVTSVDIPGVLLIEPNVVRDQRVCFVETYHEQRYGEAGMAERFVQDNYSRSVRDTLRGLHFQEPHGQGKLVMALEGVVYDVVVDVRKGSPSFGKWYGVELSGENLLQIYIPSGCAHGFCVTSGTAAFMYKCTEYYSLQDERGILWNDPVLGIAWPAITPIFSAKDQANCTLATMDTELPLYRPPRPSPLKQR